MGKIRIVNRGKYDIIRAAVRNCRTLFTAGVLAVPNSSNTRRKCLSATEKRKNGTENAMIKLSQIVNTKKNLVILMVLELAACAVLGFVVWKKQKEVNSSETLIAAMIEESNKLQKTTVPMDDYNNLLRQIQSIKLAIQATGQIAPNQPMEKPEQICNTAKQILLKQQQLINSAAAAAAAAATSASPASEVDFLVSVVEKEIAQKGAVDTQQTEKFAVTMYHMQKVLDAVGYKFNNTLKTTNQTVMKFQTDNQLKADGKIGAKTWAKVRELWNTKRPGGPMPSVTAPTPPKPQVPSQTPASAQTKPQSQTQAPAPVKPQSLSSVTTKSSVRP
jgi:hypothetical protein